MPPKKRCPPGYHRNKKTGRCNKTKEKKKVIDKEHALLDKYINEGNMEAVKQWLLTEGLDYKKLCDELKSESDDDSDDDLKKKRPKKKIVNEDEDDDDDSDGENEPNKGNESYWKYKIGDVVLLKSGETYKIRTPRQLLRGGKDEPAYVTTNGENIFEADIVSIAHPKYKVGDVVKWNSGDIGAIVPVINTHTIIEEGKWDDPGGKRGWYYKTRSHQNNEIYGLYEGLLFQDKDDVFIQEEDENSSDEENVTNLSGGKKKPAPKFKVGDVVKYTVGAISYTVTITTEGRWDSILGQKGWYYKGRRHDTGIEIQNIYEGIMSLEDKPVPKFKVGDVVKWDRLDKDKKRVISTVTITSGAKWLNIGYGKEGWYYEGRAHDDGKSYAFIYEANIKKIKKPVPKFKVGDVVKYTVGAESHTVTITRERQWLQNGYGEHAWYYDGRDRQDRTYTFMHEANMSLEDKPAPKTPTPEIHDLTLSSEEEGPPEDDDVSCKRIVGIGTIVDDFVLEYAPWTERGLSRYQRTSSGRPMTLIYNQSETDKKKKETENFYRWADWQEGIGHWRWLPTQAKINRFSSTDFEDSGKWLRHPYVNRINEGFHVSKKPKTEISGPLKLYVWERKDRKRGKFTIAGEHVNLQEIFKLLPNNFIQPGGYMEKYTSARAQHKDEKNISYDYQNNKVNRLELRAFQKCVNEINKKYKDVIVSTTAPYLDKQKPNDLKQILGWDIEAKFPPKVQEYIDKNQLESLQHCGPVRTRFSIYKAWQYRFGIHGTYTNTSRDINRILSGLFPNIWGSFLSFQWFNSVIGRPILSGLESNLAEFLRMDAYTIAFAGWGTPRGRSGHARIFVKTKRATNNYTLDVFDPWMQGTRKHGEFYKQVKSFLHNQTFRDKHYVLKKIDRPSEQAAGEGSCSAISFTRGVAISLNGDNGKTGDMPAWIPVFVKMLYNKYSNHAAAAKKAARGGKFKLKF